MYSSSAILRSKARETTQAIGTYVNYVCFFLIGIGYRTPINGLYLGITYLYVGSSKEGKGLETNTSLVRPLMIMVHVICNNQKVSAKVLSGD